MPEQLIFAMEVTLNGLLNGVMYALVALGFVLIFKASGIFNYAQGVMALFAAMTLVGIQQGRVPFASDQRDLRHRHPLFRLGGAGAGRDRADGSGDDRASPGWCSASSSGTSSGRSRSSCSWPRSAWPISSKACRT
jgi:uncharacterized membrane protein YgcG